MVLGPYALCGEALGWGRDALDSVRDALGLVQINSNSELVHAPVDDVPYLTVH